MHSIWEGRTDYEFIVFKAVRGYVGAKIETAWDRSQRHAAKPTPERPA